MIKRCLAMLVAAAMAACGSVETVPQREADTSKTFAVESGKANIYVVQAGGYFPGYNTVQVYLNGRPLGALSANTFHVVSVSPGTYVVAAASQENQESVRVAAEPNRNYFVGLKSKIGWNSMQVSVQNFSEAEGKSLVLSAAHAKGLSP